MRVLHKLDTDLDIDVPNLMNRVVRQTVERGPDLDEVLIKQHIWT